MEYDIVEKKRWGRQHMVQGLGWSYSAGAVSADYKQVGVVQAGSSTMSSRATKIVRAAETLGMGCLPVSHSHHVQGKPRRGPQYSSLLHTEQGQRELTTEVQKMVGP